MIAFGLAFFRKHNDAAEVVHNGVAKTDLTQLFSLQFWVIDDEVYFGPELEDTHDCEVEVFDPDRLNTDDGVPPVSCPPF